jgi:hypothetical protein
MNLVRTLSYTHNVIGTVTMSRDMQGWCLQHFFCNDRLFIPRLPFYDFSLSIDLLS